MQNVTTDASWNQASLPITTRYPLSELQNDFYLTVLNDNFNQMNRLLFLLLLISLAVAFSGTMAAATVVNEVDIPGQDFSNDSFNPTDLTAEIDNLPGGDSVFGTVGLASGDILDEFSFNLNATGTVSIPYAISGFTGPANDSAFVVVGDQFGAVQTLQNINGNFSGSLVFPTDTGGMFEPFVIRFDPPDGGSYSFSTGIPEPSSLMLLLLGLAWCFGRRSRLYRGSSVDPA